MTDSGDSGEALPLSTHGDYFIFSEKIHLRELFSCFSTAKNAAELSKVSAYPDTVIHPEILKEYKIENFPSGSGSGGAAAPAVHNCAKSIIDRKLRKFASETSFATETASESSEREVTTG